MSKFNGTYIRMTNYEMLALRESIDDTERMMTNLGWMFCEPWYIFIVAHLRIFHGFHITNRSFTGLLFDFSAFCYSKHSFQISWMFLAKAVTNSENISEPISVLIILEVRNAQLLMEIDLQFILLLLKLQAPIEKEIKFNLF